jgi:hypothetical protein
MTNSKRNKSYPESEQTQVQSRNGQQSGNGSKPHESEQSVFKIERYGKGQSYTRILNETLRNKQLCRVAHPLVVLAYALSKGRTWKLHSWQLRKEFGWGRLATRTVMRQLVEADFARLLIKRGNRGRVEGQLWEIRESPLVPWPPESDSPRGRLTEPRSDRASVELPHYKDGSGMNERVVGTNEKDASASSPCSKLHRPGPGVPPLADLSEEGREAVHAFSSHLSDRFPRRWLPVTKCSGGLDDALAVAVATGGEADEFAQLCRAVASVCADPRYQGRGGEYSYTDQSGETHSFTVPKAQRKYRGRNSIIDLIWENYQ